MSDYKTEISSESAVQPMPARYTRAADALAGNTVSDVFTSERLRDTP